MKDFNFDRLLKVLYLEEQDRLPLFELYVNHEMLQVLTRGSVSVRNWISRREKIGRLIRRWLYSFTGNSVSIMFP